MNQNLNNQITKTRKPFFCRLVLLMALTYYGILTLLFLSMLIFSGYIRRASEHWFEVEGISNLTLILFIIGGLLILLLCSTGLILFYMQKRGGFYLFLSGAIILLIADFFILEFDWIRYLINSGFIFILGILHFSGKCYSKRILKKIN